MGNEYRNHMAGPTEVQRPRCYIHACVIIVVKAKKKFFFLGGGGLVMLAK